MRYLLAALICATAACVRIIPVTTQAQPLVNPCCPERPCAPPDGGTEPPTDGGTPPTLPARGWLRTSGNKILTSLGAEWVGRGVNVMDTRSCNACAYEPANVGEVIRRIDEAVAWGSTLIRLDMESYSSSGGRAHWADVLHDPAYLADLVTIGEHVASLPGVYMELSLWLDPSLDSNRGWPTGATVPIWEALTAAFASNPRVIFGIASEPTDNYNGADDATVRSRYQAVVDAIRAEEARLGAQQHLIAVQGCGGWARLLSCWVGHEAGPNVVYEAHIYNPQSDFHNLVVVPKQTLPVILGEFGPWSGLMTLTDTQALMDLAQVQKIPWTAWTFHQRCEPNLLVDNSNGGCGIGMPLAPTTFGSQVRTELLGP